MFSDGMWVWMTIDIGFESRIGGFTQGWEFSIIGLFLDIDFQGEYGYA